MAKSFPTRREMPMIFPTRYGDQLIDEAGRTSRFPQQQAPPLQQEWQHQQQTLQRKECREKDHTTWMASSGETEKQPKMGIVRIASRKTRGGDGPSHSQSPAGKIWRFRSISAAFIIIYSLNACEEHGSPGTEGGEHPLHGHLLAGEDAGAGSESDSDFDVGERQLSAPSIRVESSGSNSNQAKRGPNERKKNNERLEAVRPLTGASPSIQPNQPARQTDWYEDFVSTPDD
ncbi:hypothetical protein CERZMDRAFT_87859 [Cercospora zeae-maydis SCOH1-5]|uniref:Uncharacterized protein n=1 Tax=Cercospora zeae-maydis SCOH1-5 TaxID=717836 RepID=A0A6A6F1E8_9PEZI|nr:hypothetical protein CERZMDRAFT_87859 [Cercospora zeae-maydis SCOH1-5]